MARCSPLSPPGQPAISKGLTARLGIGLSASLLLSLVPSTSNTQPVFKSIGPDGQVTYSSEPPRDAAVKVERVELPPGPTPAEKAAAEARAQALQQRVDAAAERRRAQQQEAIGAAEEAELAVREAKEALEVARVRHNPEDWQTLVTGGRVPSANYLNRVKEAEQQLRQAQNELQRARASAR